MFKKDYINCKWELVRFKDGKNKSLCFIKDNYFYFLKLKYILSFWIELFYFLSFLSFVEFSIKFLNFLIYYISRREGRVRILS